MTELNMLFLLKLTRPAGNCHYPDYSENSYHTEACNEDTIYQCCGSFFIMAYLKDRYPKIQASM